MKKIIVVVLIGLSLTSCLPFSAGVENESTEVSETPSRENESESAIEESALAETLFGLTAKELKAIEEIIAKPYVGGPYTLDDISKVSRLGYDKMYVDGEWVENTQLIEYEVVFKNGETQIISISKTMLEE